VETADSTNIQYPVKRAVLTGVLVVLIVLLSGCGDTGGGTDDASQGSVTPADTVAPNDAAAIVPTPSGPTPRPSPTIERDPQDPQIARAVEELLSGQQGVVGIVLTRPDGTIAYQQNADTPFVAASLYKLVLLADIFKKRENRELTFDQDLELLPEYFPEEGDYADSVYDQRSVGSLVPVEDLVFHTGAFSSNVAAKALLSLTSTSSLDETTIELGLVDSYLFIDPTTLPAWEGTPTTRSVADLEEALAFVAHEAESGLLNITTPHDMYRYFQLLLDGEVINPEVSTEIVEILKQQMVDDRFPYLLPKPTDMAHKTGNLDHVVHDVGIIWTPDGPVILAAMIEDPPNDDRATQIIQRLALIAYGDYDVPPFAETAVETEPPTRQSRDNDEADAEE
jgi:beta-lactamase class A